MNGLILTFSQYYVSDSTDILHFGNKKANVNYHFWVDSCFGIGDTYRGKCLFDIFSHLVKILFHGIVVFIADDCLQT